MIKGVFTGINTYNNFAEDELHGCVPDAENLLERFAADQHSLLITQAQTTKQSIMAKLVELVAGCQPGDHLVYTHSSHGMDEGLCCSNIAEKGGGWNPDTYISYSELGALFEKLPAEVIAEIIIDACHTHQGIRELGFSYGRAKYLRHSGPESLKITPPLRLYLVRWNVAMWAACQPNQTSADAYVGQSYQGAFTASLLAQDWERNRADIVAGSRTWLKKNCYGQISHLYCWHDLAMEPII